MTARVGRQVERSATVGGRTSVVCFPGSVPACVSVLTVGPNVDTIYA